MFENSKAYSGFAVKDIEKTKQFYGETLGLKISELDVGAPLPLLELHPGGDRPVLIYEKGDLTPANYTILNFPVDDVDAAVDQLAEKGVVRHHAPAAELQIDDAVIHQYLGV